jgi:phosphoglycolate phosphatase-like HAD superfamily hydrolase
MKTVVLFDIDGTLLLSGGAGRRAMERALHTHFGERGPSTMRYDGKTDPWIVRESMRHAGFTDEVIEARMPTVIAHYLEQLEHHLGETRALPGIHAVVDAAELPRLLHPLKEAGASGLLVLPIEHLIP